MQVQISIFLFSRLGYQCNVDDAGTLITWVIHPLKLDHEC